MKVAAKDNVAANDSKLKDEYNKLSSKLKYNYIQSHDGFNPCATGVLHFTGAATDGATVTIVSTDGTSKAYVAENGSPTLTQDPAEYDMSGTAAANATSFIAAVNAAEVVNATATAVDALDTTGVAAEGGGDTNTVFTIKEFSDSVNGFGSACTITLDADATTASAGHAANAISIGIDGLADAAIQALVTSAINGVAHANIKFATSGVGTASQGIKGLSAAEATSDTQITITVGAAGTIGNGTAVMANVSGEALVDVANTTGGAARVVPGHAGKIVASSGGSGIVNLTQVEPGPHGNTTMVVSAGQPSGGSNQLVLANG